MNGKGLKSNGKGKLAAYINHLICANGLQVDLCDMSFTDLSPFASTCDPELCDPHIFLNVES